MKMKIKIKFVFFSIIFMYLTTPLVAQTHSHYIDDISFQLKKTTIGKKLLQQLKKPLEDILTFNHSTSHTLVFKNHQRIIINTEQSKEKILTDVIHELTHYVYFKNLKSTPISFSILLKHVLESPGGEIEARFNECVFLRSLLKELFLQHSCYKYMGETNDQIDFTQIRKDYYKVGFFYEKIKEQLKTEKMLDQFPDLSPAETTLFSSHSGLSYPEDIYGLYFKSF